MLPLRTRIQNMMQLHYDRAAKQFTGQTDEYILDRVMMDFSKSYAMLDVPGAYEHDVYDFDGLVAAWRSQHARIQELEKENAELRERL